MRLSKRLTLCAKWIEGSRVVADIGTDHGHLLVYAIKHGLIEKGYARDVALNPLMNAKRSIEKAGLQQAITCELSDGIEGLAPDVDGLVIAGMGGVSILAILDRGKAYLPSVRQMVLQPNNHEPTLRRFLYENGYNIIDEILFEDRKKTYTILKVLKGNAIYDEADILFGPVLRRTRSSLFVQSLIDRKDKLKALLPRIQNDPQRLAEVNDEMAYLEAEISK